MTLQGICLCGAVKLTVSQAPTRLYQCHCSLCRKQSGTGSNAAFIVPSNQLIWSAECGAVSTYKKPTGFRSNFCAQCGSPVPDQIGETSYMWIAVGLLENPGKLDLAIHLFMGSKAEWEPQPATGVQHATIPSLQEVIAILRVREDG